MESKMETSLWILLLKLFLSDSFFILLLIVEKKNSNGYLLFKKMLIKKEIFLSCNFGCAWNKILSSYPMTTPFFCSIEWFELKFKYLPEFVDFFFIIVKNNRSIINSLMSRKLISPSSLYSTVNYIFSW